MKALRGGARSSATHVAHLDDQLGVLNTHVGGLKSSQINVLRHPARQIDLCDAGSGLDAQSILEDRKIGRYEDKLFTVNSVADLRTDGVKRVRIASRWSLEEQSSVGDTLRAWRASEQRVKAEAYSYIASAATKKSKRPSYPLTLLPSKKRIAFTLAEVLITLGIIGVVTALTIPTLVSNYKKHVVETKLKSTYSIMYNAINRAVADYDTPNHWEVKNNGYDSLSYFDTYFAPYLNITQKCINVYNANVEGECRRKLYYKDGVSASAFNGYNKYILTNGVGIGVWPNAYYDLNYRRKAVIDIDLTPGKKGEMLLGRDFFSFNLEFDNVNPTWTLTSTQDDPTQLDAWWGVGCKQVQGDMRTKFIKYCTQKNTSDGFNPGIYCTALIECNGWKIPDDYPIKF